ncbi:MULTISPECIES: tetratricopeptide repeat protein [unclassified Coleofasciculus]|uniref:tetratricopeptide repeat protein n=1 Tax=unclassified Coleofasciculus TaxID=2692782 RepID=UPI00187EFA51|nr:MULTISPECIES: tetratricopeptide repeat protein [unclassified Coleofasciculus]MBE9130283.1 tetratricopeptide repeat protein [Coleofasciculus sp. LEGE 07081]MBE9152560.1 tetratricopeptide repeat protein [Coleofasciculus sp. LEGE 07092]
MGNLGDYEGAIAAYEKAIQFKPEYQLAWYNWGVALEKLGKNETASHLTKDIN